MQNKEGDSPLVTAIITTHNRLPLLPRAIDSVLAQTYTNIECIVVSDASNDGTEEYCYARNDIKFIAISKTDSKGGNHARNVGIVASSGEYIAFLDDDDYWLPTKIEKQVSFAEEKKCNIVHCGKKIEIFDKKAVEYTEWIPENSYSGKISRKILLTCCVNTSSAFLIKKDLLFNIGLFDEKLQFWQDYELTIRLAQKTEFFFVPEPLIVYRIDKNDKYRLTNKFSPWLESVKYINLKHKELYKGLSDIEFFNYLLMVWGDALGRLRNAKLKEKEEYFQTLILEGEILANEGLNNRKLWHCFPLLLGILWYVRRRELTIESGMLRFLIWIRKNVKRINSKSVD